MAKSELEYKTGQVIRSRLPYDIELLENKRPEWMTDKTGSRLELDFYIPAIDVAVEVQGEQHFVYTPYFHKSKADFIRRKRRDEFKRSRCEELGIRLFEIKSEFDLADFEDILATAVNQHNYERGFVDPIDRVIGAASKLKRRKSTTTPSRRKIEKSKDILCKNLFRANRDEDMTQERVLKIKSSLRSIMIAVDRWMEPSDQLSALICMAIDYIGEAHFEEVLDGHFREYGL